MSQRAQHCSERLIDGVYVDACSVHKRVSIGVCSHPSPSHLRKSSETFRDPLASSLRSASKATVLESTTDSSLRLRHPLPSLSHRAKSSQMTVLVTSNPSARKPVSNSVRAIIPSLVVQRLHSAEGTRGVR